ncbi:MAG TPA: GlsB/YeaQ/YmgE family stress response membrane protein [Pyrinomonadaceae bacterium]|nr:GlsB/YeaQ/YmgE family stress response membrane protein [Pyrinomonadaceae bacterium]
MTLFEWIILFVVAGLCGALGQAIGGYTRGGCLVSVALGFIGALLGVWLARKLGINERFAVQIGTVSFPLVWSIIGAALFVAVINLISRGRG